MQEPTMKTESPQADQMRGELHSLSRQLRSYIADLDDPKARALFETSAEVIDGLTQAFTHFLEGSEVAWRPSGEGMRPPVIPAKSNNPQATTANPQPFESPVKSSQQRKRPDEGASNVSGNKY